MRGNVQPGSPDLPSHHRAQPDSLSENLLSRHGIPVARERLVGSLEEARRAAQELACPVVLKVVSDEITHKSEHGLVAVDLADEHALSAAYAIIEATVAQLGCPIQGYLVQEMVRDGIEVMAGVARDHSLVTYSLKRLLNATQVAHTVINNRNHRLFPYSFIRSDDLEHLNELRSN